MKTLNFPTSACRYCRYYQPEGRRGGVCQQLSVPVRGSWKACSLALAPFAPTFAPTWEGIRVIWEDEALGINGELTVKRSATISKPEVLDENSLAKSERLEPKVLLV